MNKVFLARPKEDNGSRLLEHCLKVATNSERLVSDMGLARPAFYAGLLHDLGKLNPYYQKLFSANLEDRKKLQPLLMRNYLRGHSIFSFLAAYRLISRDGISEKEKMQILFAIASHHSKLLQSCKILENYDRSIDSRFNKSFKEMLPNLEDFIPEVKEIEDARINELNWDYCLKKFKDLSIPYFNPFPANKQDYVQEYLDFCAVFSVLLQADRGSFFNSENLCFDISLNTDVLVRNCSLSKLRDEFQRQVLSNNDFKERVMVLEAPTGIGKTKIFLDIANRLAACEKFERVFYFSPLLALTEDFENKLFNKEQIESSVVSKTDLEDILIYNHTFTGSLQDKYSEIDEQEEEEKLGFFKTQAYFEMESFNKKLVITTTQRLLMTIYSNSATDKMKFLSFKNSFLIIDEVQTIPKFLLPNLISVLKSLAEKMNSRILLVSATIPNQIKKANVSTLRFPKDVKDEYMKRTIKDIDFRKTLDFEEEADTFDNRERILVMANTRRKALDLFEKLKASKSDTIYLSSGIRKKTRSALIKSLRQSEPAVVVSTQVMEAGVDVSFSKMYREVAPLDNIVQAMGRLNREAEASITPTLVVFKLNEDWRPYSELELKESLRVIELVQNSADLYKKLPEYYHRIDEENLKNRLMACNLEHKMENLEFDEVWKFVWDNVFAEESGSSVFIPDESEWDEVKQYFSRPNGPRGKQSDYRRYADLIAELPRTPRNLEITDLFEPDLMEKRILLPKKESLLEVYDEKEGLDKWLKQS